MICSTVQARQSHTPEIAGLIPTRCCYSSALQSFLLDGAVVVNGRGRKSGPKGGMATSVAIQGQLTSTLSCNNISSLKGRSTTCLTSRVVILRPTLAGSVGTRTAELKQGRVEKE